QRHLVDLVIRAPPDPAASAAAKLVAVGDWKQAIYTFRGADPGSFAQIAAACRARGGSDTTLTQSFRSRPQLIAGINHLGSHLFGAHYEPLQAAARADEVPRPAGMRWAVVPMAESPGNAATRLASEARSVADLVARAVQDGAAPGDIAILLATMGDAPSFAAALQAHGLQCVQSGGGIFEAQPHIGQTMALLQALLTAEDRLAAATALRAPLWGASDNLLYVLFAGAMGGAPAAAWPALCHGQLHPVLEAMPLGPDDRGKLLQIATLWPQLAQQARHGGAYALLRAIDASLQARVIYAQVTKTPAQVRLDLDFLQELAQRSDEQHGSSVLPFVTRYRRRLAAGLHRPLPSVQGRVQRDFVTLSSVHQSKGLQYDTVILASLSKKGSSDAAPLSYAPQSGTTFRPRLEGKLGHSEASLQAAELARSNKDQELRRLLYVAMTRGERQVIFISGAAPEDTRSLGQGAFGKLLEGWPLRAQQAGVLQ
ncbi:MAG: hypothetical protein EOO40_07075, partial [Deltaproteobacteria bacterium]